MVVRDRPPPSLSGPRRSTGLIRCRLQRYARPACTAPPSANLGAGCLRGRSAGATRRPLRLLEMASTPAATPTVTPLRSVPPAATPPRFGIRVTRSCNGGGGPCLNEGRNPAHPVTSTPPPPNLPRIGRRALLPGKKPKGEKKKRKRGGDGGGGGGGGVVRWLFGVKGYPRNHPPWRELCSPQRTFPATRNLVRCGHAACPAPTPTTNRGSVRSVRAGPRRLLLRGPHRIVLPRLCGRVGLLQKLLEVCAPAPPRPPRHTPRCGRAPPQEACACTNTRLDALSAVRTDSEPARPAVGRTSHSFPGRRAVFGRAEAAGVACIEPGPPEPLTPRLIRQVRRVDLVAR